MRALILDTSAFIQGYSSNDVTIKLYTTSLVLDEIRDELTKIKVLNWAQTGKLVVQTPDQVLIERVQVQANQIGEAQELSETDKSVLALALQISKEGESAYLVSDDYSVQNMADALDLDYTGMNTMGIKRRFQWIHYCPGCRRQFNQPQPDNSCPICGTELKRKPGKKIKRRGGQ